MSPVVSDFVHSKTTCIVCTHVSLMAMAFQGKLEPTEPTSAENASLQSFLV